MPGFPIRTSSDHSSVDNSPRTIAASHVLHRLLMPRHPPCALKHFTTTRCSHPLCNTQHTTTPQPSKPHHTQPGALEVQARSGSPEKNTNQVSPQDPTVCRTSRSGSYTMTCVPPSHIPSAHDARSRGRGIRDKDNHNTHDTRARARTVAVCLTNTVRLLRKEVIQPHLPVRLPCYDFVPIASPTFDRSPPCGLSHGLRVLPTFVT